MIAVASAEHRWTRWVAGGIAVAALTSGCGADEAPAQAVPSLSAQLDRVDAAIGSGRFGAARSALDDLVDETTQARADGALDAGRAEAILEAVGNLVRQLPPTPTSTASTAPEPPAADTSTEVESEGEDEDEHAGEGQDDEKDDKKDKGKGKHDEGHGNGPSAENGPDD